MVDVHNPDHNESTPLNTELETLAPEPTAEHADPSSTSTPAQQHQSVAVQSTTLSAPQKAPTADVWYLTAADEPDYDAADFAAALANFDREQAAETAAAQNLDHRRGDCHRHGHQDYG